eukprot:TRINITY_DN5484_c0_g4_i2.p1 TRINITY_DN5484_c0_g4~~TRINITY_DN5484_c0_g4_i2.p1  ORF type:complete len:212 (+),score=40.82 TRINITY_DN5484_c0_g4_i2:73-636(+)
MTLYPLLFFLSLLRFSSARTCPLVGSEMCVSPHSYVTCLKHNNGKLLYGRIEYCPDGHFCRTSGNEVLCVEVQSGSPDTEQNKQSGEPKQDNKENDIRLKRPPHRSSGRRGRTYDDRYNDYGKEDKIRNGNRHDNDRRYDRHRRSDRYDEKYDKERYNDDRYDNDRYDDDRYDDDRYDDDWDDDDEL